MGNETTDLNDLVVWGSRELPLIHSAAYTTTAGTPYLTEPGVAALARPQVSYENLDSFLSGFDSSLQFSDYLKDEQHEQSGAAIAKLAGQLCYMSFSPKRTYNSDYDVAKYFDNIRESGHGSVLEHANYTFLLYGINRSQTHELVRHRTGVAYSQVSQRYVDGKVLRFVERPEYRDDPFLHNLFERRIDRAAFEYGVIADRLMEKQKGGSEILSAEKRTDLRKKVNQAARSGLANETEAPMIMTGNVRAWRHIIEMRANPHAEVEIRELAYRVYLCLHAMEPHLFSDYQPVQLDDGTMAVETDTRKV